MRMIQMKKKIMMMQNLILTRTNTGITRESIANFIETLEVDDRVKDELKTITPSNYTGI